MVPKREILIMLGFCTVVGEAHAAGSGSWVWCSVLFSPLASLRLGPAGQLRKALWALTLFGHENVCFQVKLRFVLGTYIFEHDIYLTCKGLDFVLSLITVISKFVILNYFLLRSLFPIPFGFIL